METQNIKNFVLDFLKKLGLSDEESILYFSLLSNGSMTILKLSRISGVERTRIYGIAERLVKRGVLEQITDYNKKLLKAAELGQLELLIEEEKKKIEIIDKSFGQFQSVFNYFTQRHSPTRVQFYKGKSGIKQVLWNELSSESKKIYSLTYRHLGEITGMKFARKLAGEYKIRGIKAWDIQSVEFVKSLNTKIRPYIFDIHSRYIDPKIFNIKLAFECYDDVTAIFNWHEGDIFAIEIYDAKFADMIKQIHKIIWKMGVKDMPYEAKYKDPSLK